jgi:type III restriction enzyme
MKLQFKHQKFQADAAKAVVDVFAGQPYLTPTYMMDRGTGTYQLNMMRTKLHGGATKTGA